MSTVISGTSLNRITRFYDSTIGKKAVMAVSGLILFGFLIAHMPGNLQFFPLNAYDNLINGLRVIPVALFYIVAMILVGMHLSHGIWSMFQSLGFSHPKYTPPIKKFAVVFSWLLIAGFISIPIAIVAGI